MNRPIIIVGERRSGTSLISNIFYEHGAWIGNCREADEFNKKGYFENIEIAKIVSKIGKNPLLKDCFKRKIYDVLKNEGYEGGPWLVKHYVTHWYLWQGFDPIYITVKRRPDLIFKSLCNVDKKFNTQSTKIKIQKAIFILKQVPGIEIKTKSVIEGKYGRLKKAFKAADMEFDKQIVESVIDKKEWHYA